MLKGLDSAACVCSTNGCQARVVRAEKTTTAALEELSHRLARCANRCQDTAMDMMGSPPKEANSGKAQVRSGPCMITL